MTRAMVLIQIGTLLVVLARFLGVLLELVDLLLPAREVSDRETGSMGFVKQTYLKQALHSGDETGAEWPQCMSIKSLISYSDLFLPELACFLQ